ncbi:alcohol dehydrogenase [Capronia coronata CBS 617.96]|uniref:Alcohol dehydrogenase n=1 Tax=Capronia coronata CBS 617.96 TaxID=1182541 RepID=W9XMC4_9EURO|nr:alcohol dehydrogenase [Capronia coronata CBS 617.96]EXJ81692.1 alcohol dehydrogenase [Capronia coronata CBS 617.96]
MSLSGKTTLITGGGKNLGALIATLFAAEGSHLALHYNSASSRQSAETLAAGLASKHGDIKVKLYQGDLTSAGGVGKLFDAVAADFASLDIVINTVGMVLKKPLTEISEQEYDTMFAVNSKSAFFISQEAARRVRNGGKIINTVTSLLAAYAPGYTAYQGSKSPVEWFTKSLSKELMSKGISVNAVAPGPMGNSLFLRPRVPRGRGIPQVQRHRRPPHQDRRRRAPLQVPVHRRRVDQR